MPQEAFIKIRELIFQKNYDQAHKLLSELSSEDRQSCDAIALSARMHGQMGLYEEALKMFEDLESACPDRITIFKLHVNFLQEAGKIEDAADKAQDTLSRFPDHSEAYILTAECFELLGKSSEAMELIQRGLIRWSSDKELIECKTRLEPLCNQQNATLTALTIASEELELNHCYILPDDEFITRYLQLFSGREGVHAKQTKMKGRKFGYVPVFSGLEKQLVKSHIAGDSTLGIYLVKRDNTSRMLVFDIDVSKEYLSSYLNNNPDRRRIKALLLDVCSRLIEISINVGIRFICESSGYKGLHLWAFSDFDLPARYWRLLGKWVYDQLEGIPVEIHIEIFPKQDTVTEKGLGNLVKLPLGIHQASGQRSLFLSQNSFKPFAIQKEALGEYEIHTRSEFEEILGRLTVAKTCELDKENSFYKTENNNRKYKEVNKSVESALEFSIQVKIPLPERFTIEIEQILAGCQPLNLILSNIIQKQTIEAAWRHVFIYIFSTIGEEGKVFIHQSFSQLPNYNPDQVNAEIKAVPPNSMSCNKLRKNISGLVGFTNCNCQFRLPDGCYASPVIHAGIFPGVSKLARCSFSSPVALNDNELIGGASASIDRYMIEYKQLCDEIVRVNQRRILLRNRINQIFEENGKDEIVTRIATYERLIDD